jgi:hypothetical protein
MALLKWREEYEYSAGEKLKKNTQIIARQKDKYRRREAPPAVLSG